jgi:glucose-1-phosphate cytidylyltransferase
MAYKHEGFWRTMDTLKEKQVLEDMEERDDILWQPRLHIPGRVAS